MGGTAPTKNPTNPMLSKTKQNTAQPSARISKRSMSLSDFNNTSGYKVPREDHSYHIRHGIPIGDG